MPKLQMTKHGQYMITIPSYVVRTLQADKGNSLKFDVNLRRGTVELKKED